MAKNYYKNFDRKYPITDKNFFIILAFYLFECPTPNTSVRAKNFSQLGWKGASQFSNLKKKLLESATKSLRKHYYPCKKDELDDKYNLTSSVKPVEEYCVFLKHDEKTVMQSLFSAIRNAFAHGSFAIQTYKGESGCKMRIYFFCNYNEYLKAELILQEQTLLNWIDIIKSGYNPNK